MSAIDTEKKKTNDIEDGEQPPFLWKMASEGVSGTH